MKCTALFARLDVLLSGVVLVQEARCEDEDDVWVVRRMLSHTQSISSSAASSLLCSMYKCRNLLRYVSVLAIFVVCILKHRDDINDVIASLLTQCRP